MNSAFRNLWVAGLIACSASAYSFSIGDSQDVNINSWWLTSDVLEYRQDGLYVNSTRVLQEFGEDRSAGSWRRLRHFRTFADVNGDGCLDAVGFADNGVRVSVGNCSNSFAPSEQWINKFGYRSGSWHDLDHVRFLRDMNADGRSDVVGFGDAGVYISLSNGSGFDSPELAVNGFGTRQGWWPETSRRYADQDKIYGCKYQGAAYDHLGNVSFLIGPEECWVAYRSNYNSLSFDTPIKVFSGYNNYNVLNYDSIPVPIDLGGLR